MIAKLRLGNVCSKIGSGATPRGGKNSYLERGPFALIRSQNVLNSSFAKSGLAFISEEQASRLDGVEVEKFDVLLNITGDSVARVCQVAEDVLPARVNQHVAIIRPDPAVLDPRFLRYFMVQPSFQDFLLSMASSGATRNALTKGMIENFEIPAIPIGEQREIAAILGALDDKIELNRKMAAVLEAMARALYRSWFVTFDPVWAKTEGRPPAHMDPATAALFPDSFGDDGLPVGWEAGTLGAVARNFRQGADPSSIDPETPYIGLEHIPRKSIAISDWGVAEDVGSTKSQMQPGQFLFGKLRPYFHKVGLVPVQGICSTDILVVEAKKDHWREFVLSVISSVDLVEHVNAASTGTRMPRAKWQDLAGYEIALAPDAVVLAYSALVRPMHERILQIVQENQTLATLRDTLLPRLMSGDLRVGEAREQVEEIA